VGAGAGGGPAARVSGSTSAVVGGSMLSPVQCTQIGTEN
jgi:hypothetical protein